MAEVLMDIAAVLNDRAGQRYKPRVCGRLMDDGRLWEGWIEFVPIDGGPVLRTGRETEQSNRAALERWASRLTQTYLEGALHRASKHTVPQTTPLGARPAYERPAPPRTYDPELETIEAAPGLHVVLDPFKAQRQGEDVLLAELNALDTRHLRRIVEAYGLVDTGSVEADSLSRSALIELIASAARERRR